MEPRLLLLETSSPAGVVALSEGMQVLEACMLDEARRHARDLAPTVAALFAAHRWKPRDVNAVVVGRGPGSYTGLRVGLMSAKAFAYATDCRLIALDTFSILARQAPRHAPAVHVLSDAQQDKVYVQPFERCDADLQAAGPLTIQPFSDWLATLAPSVWVMGPGLRKHRARLKPEQPVVQEADWLPRPESLLQLGLKKWQAGEWTDAWTLEPLYLRPSSAEEQWERRLQSRNQGGGHAASSPSK